jgi:DNA primase
VRIPPEKIDEIRNAADIVDIIGSVVKLKKRGKNFLGLCPFHTEKTPSFNVSQNRQMYHCFGCGVGGNVFTFIMEYEKVSFVEAVRSLAEKVGMTLPQYNTEQDTAAASEQEQMYQLYRAAGLFFYSSLTETSEGKFALEYLKQRGFSGETIKAFGLGYSPGSWDALIKHAQEKGFPAEMLEKAGLARKRNDGTYYDYFRGRAMFPIFSSTGRVVGFGARKLREDDPLGKYINSPETPIYNKSRILYGLYQAKDAIRENDFVILVEGYADLISVFQAGIKNIVASSGTALTQEQIQIIGRYTKNITIIYDADSAGSKAAMRGVDLILSNDLDVRVASLPEGDDPDSFVKKHGGDAFKKLVDKSVSFIDFISEAYERQGKLSTPEGQAQAVRTIVQSIASMKDELKQNFYIKQVAEKYKLYESTLLRELEKLRGETRKREYVQQQFSSPQEESSGQQYESRSEHIPAEERDLIHAMLDGGNALTESIFHHISVEDFTHPRSRTIASLLKHHTDHGTRIDPSELVNEVDDPFLKQFISELIFSKYHIGSDSERGGVDTAQGDPGKIASDSLRVMRRNALSRMMKENQRVMKEAIRRGENTIPFLERNNQLVAELKQLESQSAPEDSAPAQSS